MPHSNPSGDAPRPVVMKFGGSSIADTAHLRRVAEVVAERSARQPVVVVVSAMGRTTSKLLRQAEELARDPCPRELDMLLSTGERASMALLALALEARGVPAISLTGSQSGIITDHRHGRARVIEVRPFRVLDELDQGRVVVVGGFQGVSYRRDVTTTGRGGSDTTAVALAAAIGADCEIYSDVDGVYTADPRRVPDARRHPEIGPRTMLALARAGSRVLHAQAVAYAAAHGVAIYARRADGTGGETIVRVNPLGDRPVAASIAGAQPVRRVEFIYQGATAPTHVALYLASCGLSYLRIEDHRTTGLWFPQRGASESQVREDLDRAARDLPAELHVSNDRGLVTVVHPGVEDAPELIQRAVGALRAAGVTTEAILSDTASLAFLLPPSETDRAVHALHAELVDSASRAYHTPSP